MLLLCLATRQSHFVLSSRKGQVDRLFSEKHFNILSWLRLINDMSGGYRSMLLLRQATRQSHLSASLENRLGRTTEGTGLRYGKSSNNNRISEKRMGRPGVS